MLPIVNGRRNPEIGQAESGLIVPILATFLRAGDATETSIVRRCLVNLFLISIAGSTNSADDQIFDREHQRDGVESI